MLDKLWRWIQRRFMLLLQLWMIAITVTIVFMYMANKDRAREGQEAHDVLCIGKLDRQRDIARAEQYLEDVRKGRRKPIQGITTKDVQNGLDDDRDSLRRLSILECPIIKGG